MKEELDHKLDDDRAEVQDSFHDRQEENRNHPEYSSNQLL